jgi:cellobiose phosphorylase
VRPCIGTEIPEFTVTRKCRGATYNIKVKNVRGNGDVKLTVNGKAISGTLVPYAKAGKVVNVDCEA